MSENEGRVSSRTEVRLNYEWKINMKVNQKIKNYYRSPIFWAKEATHILFYLEFSPNSENANESEASVILRLLSSNGEKIPVICRIFCKHFIKGTKIHIGEETRTLMEEGYCRFYDEYLSLTELSKLRDIPIVTILCEMFMNVLPKEFLDMSMHRDFKKLVGNREFSDVTLIVEGREIPAHKNILAARSPVFEAMFSHVEMMENKTKKVDITDLTYGVAREMVNYIYTGQTSEESKEMAAEIYGAADKYELKTLMTRCEDLLLEDGVFSVDRALDLLILAERNSMHRLKDKLVRSIDKEFDKVKTTEKWKDLRENHPQLVIDVMDGLLLLSRKK